MCTYLDEELSPLRYVLIDGLSPELHHIFWAQHDSPVFGSYETLGLHIDDVLRLLNWEYFSFCKYSRAHNDPGSSFDSDMHALHFIVMIHLRRPGCRRIAYDTLWT